MYKAKCYEFFFKKTGVGYAVLTFVFFIFGIRNKDKPTSK